MSDFNNKRIWTALLLLLVHTAITLQNNVQESTTKDQNSIFKMTDSNKHLVWFLQISDLHFNLFKDLDRITEFREFCHYTMDVIKPPLVIASGDITDARSNRGPKTIQIKGEWEHYANILQEFNIRNKTQWLDIRGNHDGFNIITLDSPENYFATYSVQGKRNPRSYLKQITKDNITYSFVALDVSLVPGHREPFHFLGFLDDSQVLKVKNIMNEIAESGSNHTLWFGHFPTSATVTQYNGGVRSLIGEDPNAYAYLTGHLHNYGNLVPRMFTLHTQGFLELELGDWMTKKMFRLLAFDHGFLSFVDVHHRDWPIVVITNPKHALFMVSKKEDVNIIKDSTHIRILVFSLSKIVSVKARINDRSWRVCKNIEGPLYVTQWNPKLFLNGIHTVHVVAKDVDGREKYVTQPFSLDGTTLHFDLSAELALKVDLSTIFKASFWIAFALSVLPLSTLRCLHELVKAGVITKPSLKTGCCSHRLRKLWILVTVDRIFWPLLLYPIYLAVGPWLVGFIIEDHFGVIFTWGIFINNTFLPGAVTYDVASIQLALFHIPLVIVLSNGVYWRFKNILLKATGCFGSILQHMFFHAMFVLILSFQALVIYFFLWQFGTVAALLGPIPTWSTLFAIVLWYQTLVLPEISTREAAKLWSSKIEPQPTRRT